MTTAPSLASPTATRISVAALRVGVATLILVAVVATFAETASRVTVNPFNFFGYFTLQSNIALAALLIVLAVRTSRATPASRTTTVVRAAITTAIVIVGLVYATLLAPLGVAGGVPVEWANTVMHIVTPIYGILDWVFFNDRVRLGWRDLVWMLVYPTVWATVVLVRGATDGWVPYPFLDPANGYGAVAVYVALIVVTFLAIGSGVIALSRVRGPVRLV